MATPTFPASLPAPLISGYGYQDDAGNVSSSPTEFGFQTQKQIGDTPYTNFTLQYVFTKDQMGTFEDFYKDSLINGHKWFLNDLDVGAGFGEHHCRMISKYSANLISNKIWKVSFGIETDLKNLFSSAEYDFITSYDDIEDFYKEIDYLYNYTRSYSSEYTSSLFKDSLDISLW